MIRMTRWPAAVSLGLLMSLSASALPASAGSVVLLPVVAQAAPRATDPAFAGALPESYPWVRLAEALTPAVVNVRVVGEARRARTPNIPEPFRRFFPQPPAGGGGGGGP